MTLVRVGYAGDHIVQPKNHQRRHGQQMVIPAALPLHKQRTTLPAVVWVNYHVFVSLVLHVHAPPFSRLRLRVYHSPSSGRVRSLTLPISKPG